MLHFTNVRAPMPQRTGEGTADRREMRGYARLALTVMLDGGLI